MLDVLFQNAKIFVKNVSQFPELTMTIKQIIIKVLFIIKSIVFFSIIVSFLCLFFLNICSDDFPRFATQL